MINYRQKSLKCSPRRAMRAVQRPGQLLKGGFASASTRLAAGSVLALCRGSGFRCTTELIRVAVAARKPCKPRRQHIWRLKCVGVKGLESAVHPTAAVCLTSWRSPGSCLAFLRASSASALRRVVVQGGGGGQQQQLLTSG